jgi:hypothetical protein
MVDDFGLPPESFDRVVGGRGGQMVHLVQKLLPLECRDHSFHTAAPSGKAIPFQLSKLFGKNACKLCNRERVAIVKAEFKSPQGHINSRSELRSACRRIPRFHGLST